MSPLQLRTIFNILGKMYKVKEFLSKKNVLYKTMYYIWLVSTPLNNIDQLGSLFPIHGKIKDGPNHQPDKYTKMYYKLFCASKRG